jgi:quercetin dioxygenase-like cupin family protein
MGFVLPLAWGQTDVQEVARMSAFENLEALGPLRIWDDVVAREIHGEQTTLAVVELEPGALVPEHHHPSEQLGLVISGSVDFRVAEETQELGAGGTWNIPSDVPHEVRAGPEGAVVIDTFSPTREADWHGFEREEPRTPRWP